MAVNLGGCVAGGLRTLTMKRRFRALHGVHRSGRGERRLSDQELRRVLLVKTLPRTSGRGRASGLIPATRKKRCWIDTRASAVKCRDSSPG